MSLHNEIQAAKALRETLSDILDDEDALRDTIEGETNLHEVIARVISSLDDDAALVAAINDQISRHQHRRDRVKSRLEAKRQSIAQAMLIGEIKTLETASGTATIKNTPKKLIVTEESDIPTAYWKTEPKLNRKGLLDALKDGANVPGATLSNGGQTIQIRSA